MSRLDVTTDAAARWQDPVRRNASTRSAVSDVQVLANPYGFAEVDLGSGRGENREGPITVGTVVRGLLGALPAPTPAPVNPPLVGAKDPRRVRAALVAVLREAAAQGDTLLAEGVLSPVRMSPHGVYELNQLMQATFRGPELAKGRGRRQALGAEEIVVRDKVICLTNDYRRGFDHKNGHSVNEYLANGEVGLVASVKPVLKDGVRRNQWALALARREHEHFYFNGSDGADGGSLELAYALTVHKAQGSEFEVVFVVVPESSRLLSRELAYTALTRARQKLVLLVQGDDPGVLLELTNASRRARRALDCRYRRGARPDSRGSCQLGTVTSDVIGRAMS